MSLGRKLDAPYINHFMIKIDRNLGQKPLNYCEFSRKMPTMGRFLKIQSADYFREQKYKIENFQKSYIQRILIFKQNTACWTLKQFAFIVLNFLMNFQIFLWFEIEIALFTWKSLNVLQFSEHCWESKMNWF